MKPPTETPKRSNRYRSPPQRSSLQVRQSVLQILKGTTLTKEDAEIIMEMVTIVTEPMKESE